MVPEPKWQPAGSGPAGVSLQLAWHHAAAPPPRLPTRDGAKTATLGDEVLKRPTATDPTRRALLAGAAALPVLLTACKGMQVLGTPPPPTADIRLLQRAISAEQLLIARCSGALSKAATSGAAAQGSPALTAAVTSIMTEHRQHLDELRARLVEPAGRPSATATQPSVSLPASMEAAVAALAEAEQTASDTLLGHLDSLPPSLAQLFASIAASEASHVPFLAAARSGQ